MNDKICVINEKNELCEGNYNNFAVLFSNVPEITKPLINNMQKNFNQLECMLLEIPNIFEKMGSDSNKVFQAVLSSDDKLKLKSGSIKLMSKKDGQLLASLMDPSTNKIIKQLPLEEIDLPSDITNNISNLQIQMQMAQISEQMQHIQVVVEEIKKGQENDRLATAYSCQQKFLQATVIENPKLKELSLLRIVSDAEDSRNLLMLSQKEKLEFIKNQPKSYTGKILGGSSYKEIDSIMNEIRDNLLVMNMVSLTEAMAYKEMGENAAATMSLQYYADFINDAYFKEKGLIERLDSIDSSVEYWSVKLPNLKAKIKALPLDKLN